MKMEMWKKCAEESAIAQVMEHGVMNLKTYTGSVRFVSVYYNNHLNQLNSMEYIDTYLAEFVTLLCSNYRHNHTHKQSMFIDSHTADCLHANLEYCVANSNKITTVVLTFRQKIHIITIFDFLSLCLELFHYNFTHN